MLQNLKQYIFILVFFLPLLVLAQVKKVGIPNILNYPKATYEAGTQNWGIAQDPDGFMYFANNDGLLRFDGLNWDLFKVSTTSPIRSVCIDDKGTIYVGTDNDFGIFKPVSEKGPVFISLLDKLPEDIPETDIIWKIYDTQYGIIFQSFKYIFIYRDGKIQLIKPEKAFYYSFYVNKRLFFHEPGVGLFEYINGFVNKVPWATDLKDTEILSIISFYENQLLIGTSKNGWFEYKNGKLEKWDVPANKQIDKDVLFCAVKLEGNNIAMGTILNGLIVSNSDGVIIQNLNRSKGLQNNTILSLYNDQSGNLWLGLDNGIDYVELNSPLSYISSADGISTGYSCVIYNDILYLGTNQGLFAKSFRSVIQYDEEKFQLVPGTEGQVWGLNVLNGKLLCGHNLGVFAIDRYKATKISGDYGAWRFIQVNEDKRIAIGGNYYGLDVYTFDGRYWKFSNKVKGFNESSRFLTEDKNGNYWISHGTRGVFWVTLTAERDSAIDVKKYGVNEGLPSDLHNILLNLGERWCISTADGLYSYNETSDRFYKDEKMNALFGFKERLKFVETDEHGNYWYITDLGMGVLLQNEDGSYANIRTPFKQLDNKLVNEWEFLYVHGTDNVFIATEDGFAHYSSRIVASYNQSFRSFITSVDVPSLDTVVYPGGTQNPMEFPYKKNAFRFHFSAPSYQNPGQLRFSYFIDHYSEDWSPWSHDNYRDITNLRENKYVFRVKARNSFGVESEEASFTFIIKPPWYRSKLAMAVYILLTILVEMAVALFISKRYKKSKQKERKQHEKELLQKEKEFEQQSILAEKEIIRLKNEKLEAKKLSLDKELANQTLSIVNKNKFLMKVNEELKRVSDGTSDSTVKAKMTQLKKRIDKEIDNQHQNQIFETYFEEVHEDFFQRLKEQFPDLSPKDLRLCAYIRMNMSTKEIATLLNISERGVEISRYRLRKKLDLSREVNLSTFLLNL